MDVKIALLAGDGIGPRSSPKPRKCWTAWRKNSGHKIEYRPALVGAAVSTPWATLSRRRTPSVLRRTPCCSEPSGTPNTTTTPRRRCGPSRLLRMRKSLGLFANLRPVALFDALADRSPLRAEVVRGTDFICVRELTGGIYWPSAGPRRGGRARLRHLHLHGLGDRTGLHVAFRPPCRAAAN